MADENVRDGVSAEKLDYRFAGFGYQNWHIDGEPPVVLNRAATLHAKLAWCWGEVSQIDHMASVLCTSDHQELASIGNLLSHKALALTAMLEHLALTTKPPRQGAEPGKVG